jgi:hypothetical protein
MNANTATNANLYRINADFISQQIPADAKIASVYIPYIHVEYDATTICVLFQHILGTVCRIDFIAKNQTNPYYRSVFIYYYENNFYNIDRSQVIVQESGAMKIYPRNYIARCNISYKRFKGDTGMYLKSRNIKPEEYLVLLPNKTMFPDTTLTLEEIEAQMDRLEDVIGQKDVIGESQELETLAANREFLSELYYVRNTYNADYKDVTFDTPINIHQLAQNIKLLEDRLAAAM